MQAARLQVWHRHSSAHSRQPILSTKNAERMGSTKAAGEWGPCLCLPPLPGFIGCIALIVIFAAPSVFAQKASPPSAPAAQQTKQEAPPGEKAPAKPEQKHSSPEDRQRLVTVAHKLEAAPLDATLGPDRAWAVQWVVSAPDLPVRICTTLLADLRRPRYKYRTQMTDQLLISSAAFIVEHPEEGKSLAAQNTSGLEGVLKAYKAILKTDPQATAQSLDDYLQKQKEGKLAATVEDIVKGCH